MRKPRLCFLALVCLSAVFGRAQPPPTTPANPISQYGDVRCGQQDVVVPTSTLETAAAVGYYYRLSPPFGPAAVKLRVASRIRNINLSKDLRYNLGFGDRSGFTCASGAGATRTATISTQEMRSVLATPSSTEVTFQAGATLTQLVDFANSAELTLPLGTIPSYLDLTLGGLLSTGAHGHGPPGSSNFADIVTTITFVDGKGQVRTVSRSDLVGRALSGGLGLLGVITEVTLRLQPGLFKTKTWAIGPKPDTGIATELPSLIDQFSGHLWAYWRPDQGLVKYQVFQEVPGSTPSDPPETDGPTRGGFLPPNPDSAWAGLAQALTAFQLGQPSPAIADQISAQVAGGLLNQSWVAAGAFGSVRLQAATGLTNNLQGQDCNPPGNVAPFSCFFDPRVWERIRAAPENQQLPSFTFEESEFALLLTRIPDFISDMQQLASGRNALDGATWPVSFILFRPGGTTRDLIHPASSTSAVPERIVWVELATFRPQIYLPAPTFPAGLRLQKKLPGIQEAFEQLMTCKYGARPHWGKSWERVYTSTACPVRDLFPSTSWLQQLALAKLYDPAAMFETSLVSSVISGGQAAPLTPSPLGACTIEMTCYCKVDADCQYQGLPVPPLPAFFVPPLSCQALPSRIFPGKRIKVCLP